jgi:hypothetical protein
LQLGSQQRSPDGAESDEAYSGCDAPVTTGNPSPVIGSRKHRRVSTPRAAPSAGSPHHRLLFSFGGKRSWRGGSRWSAPAVLRIVVSSDSIKNATAISTAADAYWKAPAKVPKGELRSEWVSSHSSDSAASASVIALINRHFTKNQLSPIPASISRRGTCGCGYPFVPGF